MVSFAISAVVGALLGFLAGLGVGGGSLLMLWLTLVLGMSHDIARGINLLFFIPTAAISCLFRKQQGTLQLKQLLPAILAAMAAAAAGNMIASFVTLTLIKKAFGILLIFAGLRELFYRPRKAR